MKNDKQTLPCCLELSKLGQLFWCFFVTKKTLTKWVWRISKLILFSFFFCKKRKNQKKKENSHQGIMSLWVWTEFGESLERVWRISKLTPNSQGNHCLMSIFFFLIIFFKKIRQQNEFGESPNSLQTLSKLKKMRAHFFSRKLCVQPVHKKGKKVCARIFFFEFGESLERVWREFGDSPNSFCFRFFLQKIVRKNENWHQTNTSL